MSAIRTIKRKIVHLYIRNKHYKYTEIIEEIIPANVNEVIDLTADTNPVQPVQSSATSSNNFEDINTVPTPNHISEYEGYNSPYHSGNFSDISTDSAPENVHE